MGGPGGGDALAEAVAAGEGALVEPGVGVDGHRLAPQLLYPDGRHGRLQLRQQPLDPHCRRRRKPSPTLRFSLSLSLSEMVEPRNAEGFCGFSR